MERLINDDCFKTVKQLDDDSVDLIITDPPYIVGNVGMGAYGSNHKHNYSEIKTMSNGFNESIFDEFVRVMKHINIYIFCSQKQIPMLINYFVKKHHCNWNLLTWHKTNPVPACNNKYLTDTEFCFFAREKGVKIRGNYQSKKTYYISPLNRKDKKKFNHPTVKPLSIVHNLVLNSSSENEVVLDPFMGSGTTGVACKELERNFIGIELDNTYFENAVTRINNT